VGGGEEEEEVVGQDVLQQQIVNDEMLERWTDQVFFLEDSFLWMSTMICATE